MKDQIKVWFLRIVVVVILAIAIKVWGIPLYHQYFTPEKALAFVPTSAVKRVISRSAFTRWDRWRR